MIKGVNKHVIEVLETGNVYYDKALLFVKPEYANIEKNILENEAKKLLKNLDTVSTIKHAKKIMFGVFFFISAFFIGIISSLIFINIFTF